MRFKNVCFEIWNDPTRALKVAWLYCELFFTLVLAFLTSFAAWKVVRVCVSTKITNIEICIVWIFCPTYVAFGYALGWIGTFKR